MDSVFVRSARPDDRPVLDGLFREFNRFYCGLAPRDYREVTAPEPCLARLEDRSWHGDVFVAAVGNKPAGVVCVEAGRHISSSVDPSPLTARISNLFVPDDFRKHGVGTNLLAQTIGWARREKFNRVEIKGPSKNQDGRSLAETLGFKVDRIVMGAVSSDFTALECDVEVDLRGAFNRVQREEGSWAAVDEVARVNVPQFNRLLADYSMFGLGCVNLIVDDARRAGHQYLEAVVDLKEEEAIRALSDAGFKVTHRVLGFDFD